MVICVPAETLVLRGPGESKLRIAIRELRALLEVLMHASQSAAGDCLYELSYADLVRDPIGEIQSLYSWLGTAWEGEAAAAIAGWLAQNPQHKHGVHRYRIEDHGLSPEFARASFEDYRAAFGGMFAAGV
jgi:Sulfotransferase family